MTEVLYRKWRPQSFAEVAGQELVTRTLRNSVASGRLAHAYLLCGPRGTGKTSLGRLLAKAANCAAPLDGEPCNKCDSCTAFREGRAMDFIEQDAASHNSVDDIRQLRENVVLTPMSGQRKVYLLDEVHMLSKGAENALLKTLEEPPPHIIFVLATTDPHKVEATIISRCQRFDLRRIPASAVTGRLGQICQAEGFSLDQGSLEEIARGATGSLRDAINALEQVVTYYGRSPSFEQVQEALGLGIDARSGQLARLALAGDLSGGLKLIAIVRDDGVDMRQFAKQTVRYLRGLLLAKAGVAEALDLPREMAAEVKAEAAKLDRAEIIRALRTFGRVDFRDETSASGGSLPLELALVEIAAEATQPPRVAQPEPAPPPRPEPQFSIPVAELDQVASTVTSTTIEPPSEANGAPEEASVPEREPQPAAASAIEPPLEANGVPEEVSVPEREPQPAAASANVLEQVRQACKDTDKQLSALLNGSCEVKSLDSDKIVLGFYHTFHLERIESGPFAGRLDELFSAALGRPVKVAYEHAPRSRPAASDRPPPGGRLVQAAREMGARAIPRPSQTEGGQGGEPRRNEP